MNAIDLVACLLVGILALMGFRQGFLKGISTLVSIAIGLFVAVRAWGWCATLLVEHTSLPSRYAPLLAFLLLFFVASLGVWGAARVAISAIQGTPLVMVDRFCGLGLGLVKGGLAVLLMAGIVSLLPLSGEAERYVNSSLVITEARKVIPRFMEGVGRWLEEFRPTERSAAYLGPNPGCHPFHG